MTHTAIRVSELLGLSGALLAVVACAAQPNGTPSSPAHPTDLHVEQKAPRDPGAGAVVVESVAVPPPAVRGPTVTVIGSVRWSTGTPGCVMIELAGGQRFQLTGTPAAEGERRARAGDIPVRQQLVATGHIPPVGATSCGPIRAFWAERVTAH